MSVAASTAADGQQPVVGIFGARFAMMTFISAYGEFRLRPSRILVKGPSPLIFCSGSHRVKRAADLEFAPFAKNGERLVTPPRIPSVMMDVGR
jgi:hypothetical protein